MDKVFRFSDYDLIGYLAAGIIVFGLCDFAIGTQIVWKDSWSISSAVAVILGGYVDGHIVSALAALVADRWLVRRLLGTPANLLLRANARKITLLQRVALGNLLEPLHPALRSRLLERADMSTRAASQPGAGEEVFWRA